MASVRHLEFAKFWFFVKRPSWELKSTSAYQIWSKSDNFGLRYGNNAIFKMAAVRHLEFAKIAVLVMWPISACDLHLCSKFRVDRPIRRWDIAKNDFQYGVRPPSWICYDVIILHPKTTFYVPNFVLTFHGVRFRNFCNILYFMFQHFGLKLPILGLLNFDDFWWKIVKNVKIKYSYPQKAYPWRKTRLISVERWRFIRRRDLQL